MATFGFLFFFFGFVGQNASHWIVHHNRNIFTLTTNNLRYVCRSWRLLFLYLHRWRDKRKSQRFLVFVVEIALTNCLHNNNNNNNEIEILTECTNPVAECMCARMSTGGWRLNQIFRLFLCVYTSYDCHSFDNHIQLIPEHWHSRDNIIELTVTREQ